MFIFISEGREFKEVVEIIGGRIWYFFRYYLLIYLIMKKMLKWKLLNWIYRDKNKCFVDK